MGYTPEIQNKTSTLNSVVLTNVSGGTVWTGTGEEVSKYGRAGISIWSPFGESSPTPVNGVLTIQVSRDNVNWGGPNRDFSNTAIAQPHMWSIIEKYFRIVWTHGTTSASTVDIQTQYSVNADVLLGHQLDEIPLPEHEGINVRAFAPSTFDFSSGALSADTEYTSQAFDTLINGYGVATSIKSSTDGTHYYEESNDGINWVIVEEDSIVGNVQFTEGRVCASRYFRLRFLNGIDVNIGGVNNFYHSVSQRLTLPNEAQSATRVSDKNSFFTSIAAASGTTLEGKSETVDGYTSISASVSSTPGDSLNGTLWFQVSRDGILWNSIPRDVRGSDKSIPFLIAITRKYFKIKYVNGLDSGGNAIATTSTSNFQLQTIYARGRSLDLTLPMGGNIQDKDAGILTKTVLTGRLNSGNYKNVGADSDGNLKVSVINPLGAFGALQTEELTPIVQLTFPYNINTNLVNTYLSGGTVTQGGSMAVVTAGPTTAESAILESKGRIKYRAGQGVMARFTTLYTTGVTTTDSHQMMGIGGSDNGYFFGYTGSTFGIHHITNGERHHIPQAEWNVDVMDGSSSSNNPTGMLLNHSKGNVYQIQYQWLGYGAIKYFIEHDKSGDMALVHVDGYSNNHIVPSSYDPTFHLRVLSNNASSTDTLIVKTSSMAGFIEGLDVVTGPTQSTSTVGISSVARKNLLTLRAVEFFPTGTTQECKVTSILKKLSLANDGANNTTVKIEIMEGATITTPTYNYIDANNSVVEYDTTGTYGVGTGKVLSSFLLTSSDAKNIDLSDDKFKLENNGTISFIASGDVSTTTDVSISWVEDF